MAHERIKPEFLFDEDDPQALGASSLVDTLRFRIDTVKAADEEFKEYVKEEKKRKRRAVHVDSDLTEFLE